MMNYFIAGLTFLNLLSSVHAKCKAQAYEFSWRGQFAGFMVKGRFVFDSKKEYTGGIVREGDLLDLTIEFFSPTGTLLQSYKDNQNEEYVNFAFNTVTEELLQDGPFDVDDDILFYRNGFNMGKGNPALRGLFGEQSGISFWSRPTEGSVPHIHVDDWYDENGDTKFGFPIGYSTHRDASFPYTTTQAKLDGGKVGSDYYVDGETNNLASDVNAFGQMVRIKDVKATGKDKKKCSRRR